MVMYAADSARGSAALVTWIAGAVDRGEKVLYELAPGESSDSVLRSSWAGLAQDAVASGQLEMLDTAGLRAECGGRADGLHDVHRSRMARARDDGWAGLAIATGGEVLTAVVQHEPSELTHDRGVTQLVDYGMSSLCRYHPDESAALLDAMLAAHHPEFDDEIWGATLLGDRLRVRGEIDMSNAARVAPVLRGAVAVGVRAVDVAELEFCAAAGVRSLATVADILAARGEQLAVVGAGPALRRVFALVGLTEHPGIALAGDR